MVTNFYADIVVCVKPGQWCSQDFGLGGPQCYNLVYIYINYDRQEYQWKRNYGGLRTEALKHTVQADESSQYDCF